MYDLTSSKEGGLKPPQYISVTDGSLLLRAHVVTIQAHHLKRLSYLISFHQLLGDAVDVVKMFRCTNAVDGEPLLRPLVVTTPGSHLGRLFY